MNLQWETFQVIVLDIHTALYTNPVILFLYLTFHTTDSKAFQLQLYCKTNQ